MRKQKVTELELKIIDRLLKAYEYQYQIDKHSEHKKLSVDDDYIYELLRLRNVEIEKYYYV